MSSILINILIFLSVVFIIVLVHEFGHFIVAKLFGVKVLRFSIGFGKPLLSFFGKTGTEYAIAPIPLGGYVKLVDTREGPVSQENLPDAFDLRPIYQRFLIVAAGPVFNFLFAILCFWLVFTIGITYVKPVVGKVVPNSPAALAGIRPGDQIISINGRSTFHWPSVSMALVRNYGSANAIPVSLVSKNQPNVSHEVQLNLKDWQLNPLKPNPLENLGIQPYIAEKKIIDGKAKIQWPPEMLQRRHDSIFSGFIDAVSETVNFITFNFAILYKMFTGVISWKILGGPISIIEAASIAAKQGLIIYLNFLALLSISIGFLNLLPIPGLDGGQILFQIIELLRGKPVSLSVQVLMFRLGIILLVLIMVQAMLNDLLRI